MGLRVYIKVSMKYREHIQIIGMLVLSYINQKTRLMAHCSQFRENYQPNLCLTGDNDLQTTTIYNLVKDLDKRLGVFEEVSIQQRYYPEGKPVTYSNGNNWHDLLYDTIDDVVYYFLKFQNARPGYKDELSSMILALDITRDSRPKPQPRRRSKPFWGDR